MKKLFLSLLLGVMMAYSATAQEQSTMSPEYEREYHATIERISQRLDAAMTKLEAGDSTALAEVASLESSMAYVFIQMKEDYESALPWVRRCIERNADLSEPHYKSDIAKAHMMMSLYYRCGLAGIEKDSVKSFEWYEKAAHMGDSQGMFELGLAYHYGEVVEANERKAFEWWLASANDGFYDAYRNVAIGYYFGNGVKRDYTKAAQWAEKGVDADDGYCTLMLGIAHYKGQGVKRNYEKAFGWFNLSVRQGEPSANQALAECYYYGRGVERDYEQAKILCQRGVELEDEEAVKFMKKLRNK